MSRSISVLLAKNLTAVLAAGVAFAGTKVDVTDAAGTVQSVTLTGAESPPWSATFTSVDDGAGSVLATDLDTTGATIGTPVQASFPAVTVTPPATFPQTTGITVSPA